MREGHFIQNSPIFPPKILLEVLNYWEKFHTKFTSYSSKDIITGIKYNKKGWGKFHAELTNYIAPEILL